MKTFRLISALLLIIVGVSFLSPMEARRTSLKLKAPAVRKGGVAKVDIPVEAKGDTVIFGHEVSFRNISFSGFDKPAASEKESFLIFNSNPLPLTGLKIEISYFTTSGELLHRRVVSFHTNVPPQERRLVEVKSFDSQHSYIYRESIVSRRSAIPFSVRMRIISATFAPLRRAD